MEIRDITVVICCAGMGTRLGIGTTKALVKVNKKSIIQRQLELLKDFDDVRIVVGYQADQVIKEVNKIRSDIMFVFNYDFQNTGVADSLRKGITGARKYTLYLDGDILINEEDFRRLVNSDFECLGVNKWISDEPILAEIENDKVISLGSGKTFCWPGVALLSTDKYKASGKNVYDVIRGFLPLKYVVIRAREIDTVEDYECAVVWINDGAVD